MITAHPPQTRGTRTGNQVPSPPRSPSSADAQRSLKEGATRVEAPRDVAELRRPPDLDADRRLNVHLIMSELNSDRRDLGLLPEVYAPDIDFQDPSIRIQGRQRLGRYLAGLNRKFARFSTCITAETQERDKITVDYQASMRLAFGPLTGPELKFPARAVFEFRPNDPRVSRQEDQYDARAIFNQVPVIGGLLYALRRPLAELSLAR